MCGMAFHGGSEIVGIECFLTESGIFQDLLFIVDFSGILKKG
jgi:hypothetical protein